MQTNAELTLEELGRFAAPDSAGAKVMAEAVEQLRLSMEDHRRALRLARTIADLDASDAVCGRHVAEALRGMSLPSSVTMKARA
jgi:magnesium chelatase family protein